MNCDSSVSSKSTGSLFSFRKSGNIYSEQNHVYFYSEVDRDTTRELIDRIRETEGYCLNMMRQLNKRKIPLYLHINSFGGCIFSAFNVIDYIEALQVPVYTIVEGATASAGTLISVCGSKRFIRPNAHMLIHQLSSGCWGKMCEIEDEYSNLKDLMVKIKRLYKEKTSIPSKEIKRLLKHDLWLSSDLCVEYGLVDGVWS